MTHTRAKNLVQRSIGAEDRIETNGRTDANDRATSPASAVGNKLSSSFQFSGSEVDAV